MNTITKLATKTSLVTRASKRGATMVEYALMLFLLLIVAFGAFKALGSNVKDATQNAADKLK
jgi:Flp pilus assembly pilin Flp